MEVIETNQTNQHDITKKDKVIEKKFVKYLVQGDSYGQFSCFYNIGEKYLLQTGDQELHLASYSKQCINLPQINSFLKQQQGLHNNFVQFQLLQSFNRTIILDIINQMEKTSHQIGDVIYKEDSESDKLFFIFQGSFKFIKKIEIDKKGDFKEKQQDKQQIRKNLNRKFIKNNEITILQQYESFGEEILIGQKRKYTVKCNQNDSILYQIKGNNFKKIMHYYNIQENYQNFNKANNFRKQLFFKQEKFVKKNNEQIKNQNMKDNSFMMTQSQQPYIQDVQKRSNTAGNVQRQNKDGLFNKYHKRIVHLDQKTQKIEAQKDKESVERYFNINNYDMKDKYLFKLRPTIKDYNFLETSFVERRLKVDQLKTNYALKDNFIIQNQKYHLSSYVMFNRFKDIFKDKEQSYSHQLKNHNDFDSKKSQSSNIKILQKSIA